MGAAPLRPTLSVTDALAQLRRRELGLPANAGFSRRCDARSVCEGRPSGGPPSAVMCNTMVAGRARSTVASGQRRIADSGRRCCKRSPLFARKPNQVRALWHRAAPRRHRRRAATPCLRYRVRCGSRDRRRSVSECGGSARRSRFGRAAGASASWRLAPPISDRRSSAPTQERSPVAAAVLT